MCTQRLGSQWPASFSLAPQVLNLSRVCVVQLVSSLRQNQSKGLWALVAAWVRHLPCSTCPHTLSDPFSPRSILTTPGAHSHRHHGRIAAKPDSTSMPLDPPFRLTLSCISLPPSPDQDERFVGGEGVGLSSGVEAVVVINLLLICRRLLQQVGPTSSSHTVFGWEYHVF